MSRFLESFLHAVIGPVRSPLTYIMLRDVDELNDKALQSLSRSVALGHHGFLQHDWFDHGTVSKLRTFLQ